jgi:2-polyprenyl-6-hydroxyphenyl methylase/3-demethylubiquinone-9 3-methyltransferase
MAVRGANVTGIDLSEKPLGVAKLHCWKAARKSITARFRSKINWPTKCPALRCRDLPGNARARAEPFQRVTACARLVKPGGQVFLSTLNRNPKSYLFAVVGAEYMLACCPRARTTTPSSSSRPNWHAGPSWPTSNRMK